METTVLNIPADSCISCLVPSCTSWYPPVPLGTLLYPLVLHCNLQYLLVHLGTVWYFLVHFGNFPYLPFPYLCLPSLPSPTFPYLPLLSPTFSYLPLSSPTFPYLLLPSPTFSYLPLSFPTFPLPSSSTHSLLTSTAIAEKISSKKRLLAEWAFHLLLETSCFWTKLLNEHLACNKRLVTFEHNCWMSILFVSRGLLLMNKIAEWAFHWLWKSS